MIDRYYYSGCVYSAAKSNPSLSLQWARKPDEGLPRPDVCIFLDISPPVAAERGGFGNEKYEKKEMQDRVRQLFTQLRQAPERDDFIVIDGGQSLLEVEEAVLQAVEKAIQDTDHEQRPLRRIVPW